MKKSTRVKFYFGAGLLVLLLCFGFWGLFFFCQFAVARIEPETLHDICGTLLFCGIMGAGGYCIGSVIMNYRNEESETIIRR